MVFSLVENNNLLAHLLPPGSESAGWLPQLLATDAFLNDLKKPSYASSPVKVIIGGVSGCAIAVRLDPKEKLWDWHEIAIAINDVLRSCGFIFQKMSLIQKIWG